MVFASYVSLMYGIVGNVSASVMEMHIPTVNIYSMQVKAKHFEVLRNTFKENFIIY